jgi:hypothetical protein
MVASRSGERGCNPKYKKTTTTTTPTPRRTAGAGGGGGGGGGGGRAVDVGLFSMPMVYGVWPSSKGGNA